MPSPHADAGCVSAMPRQGRPDLRASRRSSSASARVCDAGQTIHISLSHAQVDQVVREASRGPSVCVSLLGKPDEEQITLDQIAEVDNARMSRSLLIGLIVLAVFPADGIYVRVVDVARRVGLNMSTAHRYISTLQAVGLVERDPDSRQYRRVVMRPAGSPGG
jgi:predicted transcriptional regulator